MDEFLESQSIVTPAAIAAAIPVAVAEAVNTTRKRQHHFRKPGIVCTVIGQPQQKRGGLKIEVSTGSGGSDRTSTSFSSPSLAFSSAVSRSIGKLEKGDCRSRPRH